MLRRSLGWDLLDEEPGADLPNPTLFCDRILLWTSHCCQTHDFDDMGLMFDLSVRWYFPFYNDITCVDLCDVPPLLINVNTIKHVTEAPVYFNKRFTISNSLHFISVS